MRNSILSPQRTIVLLSSIILLIGATPLLARLPTHFSQSALNSINADLQEEIIAGSTNNTSYATPFYAPWTNQNMLPQLVGSTGTGGMENLLKVSIPQPFYTGTSYTTAGSTRASPALTTGTSLNGRTFTAALWNLPLLMPVTSGTDYTPLVTTGSFTPPNWILVAQDGSNPNTWSSNLLSSASNSSTVVGRYAYTIYHEGGLLDANVAGYPSTSTPTQVGYKTGLPYADLTQIGLTQSQVDTLVGWRNYATTQPPGTPIDPAFTATSGSNYYQYVLSNTTGFLTPNTATYNGQTDQQFTSRQQLINFSQNALGLTGTNLDALNYLATFTRGVNQPSFAPKSVRPLQNFGSQNGSNDAQGAEAYSQVSNPINPNFLQALVSGIFLRNDGSTAVVGEPLVNKRFALSRLAWITYLGPSAYRNIPTTNPGINSPDYDMWQLVNVYGISPAYLAQGTAANIQNYFGLVWQIDALPSAQSGNAASFHDGEYKWFYTGHCEAGTSISGTAGFISRIVDIANQGTGARDPDFFELLKATVVAGSKAKALASYTLSNQKMGPYYPWTYNALLDSKLDYAILQLGANIIDQFKVDGYASRIVFNDGIDLPQEFRGAENLPYLYRMQSGVLKLRMENAPGFSPGITNYETDYPTASIKDAGVCMVMHTPVVWDPYDSNAPMGAPAPAGPAILSNISGPNIRIVADSVYPDGVQTAGNTTGYNIFGALAQCVQPTVAASSIFPADLAATRSVYTTGTNGTGAPIIGGVGQISTSNWPPPPAAAAGNGGNYAYGAMTPLNSALTFNVPTPNIFREPSVLAMEGLPTGSNLKMAAPLHVFDYNSIENSAGKLAWTGSTSGSGGFLSDGVNPLGLPTAPASTQPYVGFCAGLIPEVWYGPAQRSGTAGVYESVYPLLQVYSGNSLNGFGSFITYRMQYQDPNPADPPNSWITYDEKYVFLCTLFLFTPFGTTSGNLSDQADGAQGGDWSTFVDPRTSRFSSLNGRDLNVPVQTPGGSREAAEWADPANGVGVTDRPDNNSGYAISVDRGYGVGNPFYELQEVQAAGWTLTDESYTSNAAQGSGGHFRMGLLSQNSSSINDNGIRFAGDTASVSPEGPMYYSDPDGVDRGAMGNYVQGNGNSAPAIDTVGLPMATAYPAGYTPVTTGAYQAQSRPYFLHRPFQSVAELGYVFSGTPWKNLDLFTPQSGDSPLLDIFTINETPPESANPNNLVAGTVNLNTHQAPVLQALLSGAYVDEVTASQGTTSTAVPPLNPAAANAIATSPSGLIARTTGTGFTQGPLENVSELVGAWNSSLGNFVGPSGDLTNIYASAFSGSTLEMMQNIQRFRESFIRPLAAAGNTRLWNLMIDLVVQNGQYPASATGFDNFLVNCEQRYWVHESIDRFTGQIVAQNVETVGPNSLLLSGSSVFDNLAPGANVATLNSSELSGGGPYTYTLVNGNGANNNSSFTIVGNQLQTNGVFDYFNQSTYTVLVGVTDTNGLTYIQPVTINVQPGPYSQWKQTYFGSDAGNESVAGDQVDSQNDNLPNLLKYALGKSPLTPDTSGITVKNTGHTLTMTYPKADAATDVTISVVAGSDLSNSNSWTANGVTQTMISDNGTTQQWQASTPVTGGKQLFMHLVVTRP